MKSKSKSKSKFIIVFFLVLVFLVIAFKFEQFVIEGRYTIHALVPCDSGSNRCFAVHCDGVEGCVETPYKKIEIRADIAPKCVKENDCESFSCPSSHPDLCTETYCQTALLEEGEGCLGITQSAIEEDVAENASGEQYRASSTTEALLEGGTEGESAPEEGEVATSSDSFPL